MAGTLQVHGLIAAGTARKSDAPPHRLLALGPFDALISDFASAPPDMPPSPEALAEAAMKHHHILQAYCAEHALLPLQFGAVFSSADALRDALHSKLQLYRQALAVLATHREFSVTVQDLKEAPAHLTTEQTGRAFLDGKRSLHDRRRDLARNRCRFLSDLETELRALSAQPLRIRAAQPTRLLDASMLISFARLDGLRTFGRHAGAQAQALGLQLQIVGPWPAYHFDMTLLEKEPLFDVA